MRVTDLIAQDHRTVRELFERVEAREHGLARLVEELEVHARAEEAVFYPAVRRVSRRIDDAEAGHRHLRDIIGELQGLDPSADDFVGRIRVLKQSVLNHAAEEEGGVFMDAAHLGLDELDRLGEEMAAKKQALQVSLRQGGRKVA